MYGEGVQDSHGVHGVTDTGAGVWGLSDGDGVLGQTNVGIGVHALASGTGTALAADGPVRFSSAGLGTIARHAISAVVHPAVALTSTDKVLITLMSDPGHAVVQYVTVDPASGTFTLYVPQPVLSAVLFAYFVIS